MAEPNTRVDDIALFFRDDAKAVATTWIPYTTYTKKKTALKPEWNRTIFTEEPVEGKPGARYYVANLSRLLPPGTPIKQTRARPLDFVEGVVPGPEDLVIIPNDDAKQAYVVSRADYMGLTLIDDESGADLKYMALVEGVILANLPKADLVGMTCYVLNLCGLAE